MNFRSVVGSGRWKPAELSVRQSFALIILLFFTWGFLGTLNDVLVAALKAAFHLKYANATLVQVSFFSTCFFSSLPAAAAIRLLGYQKGMALGLGGMALGTFLFAPAALTGAFLSFLSAVMVTACGSTILQTAAGPYVTYLGPPQTASSRFSLALAVNSLGSFLAPLFGGKFFFNPNADTLLTLEEVDFLALPYIGISASLLLLLLAIFFVKFPMTERSASQRNYSASLQRSLKLFQFPHFTLGVMAMFLYVGAEIAIGSLLLIYLAQADIMALPRETAAFMVSLYWAGAMVGRFFGWIILRRWNSNLILSLAAFLAFGLVSFSVSITGPFAGIAMISVGLCNSVIVPILFPTAISHLGDLTEEGSGLLVAALVGGAVIPYLQGVLADHIGLHYSFFLPDICYLFIGGYAFWMIKRNKSFRNVLVKTEHPTVS